MANPPITRFTSLATSPTSGNPNNGLYVPPLNTAQIAAIPATTKVNGGIWYNTNTNNLEAVVNNTVKTITTGGAGGGDVVGPGGSTQNNLVSFGDNTGKLIADSGIAKDNVVIAAGGITANKLLEFTGAGKNVQESALVADNLVTNTGTGVENNIVVFDGATGKVIKDSTVSIKLVDKLANAEPALLRFSGETTIDPPTQVNEIGNLGHIRFIEDVCSIYVGGLTSIRFFPFENGGNSQVCSVFTSEIGLSGESTGKSALVEIKTDSGALLLSRLTETQRNDLSMVSGIDGTNGMLLFNTDTLTFNGYDGTNWRDLLLLNPNGTLDLNNKNIINLLDPANAQDAATKAYVDAAVSGIPTATITLNGNVTGSGVVTSPITTTLNMTLDQIKVPVANLDLNSKNIINLLDPTTAQQAATKNYVDTRSITLSGAVTGTGALGTTISTILTSITTSQISDFNSAVTAFRLDQFSTPITSLNLGSQKIINLLDPTLAQDATTKNYVDTRTITVSGAVTGSGALGTTIATTLTNINTSQITNFNAAVTAFRLDQFAAPTASVNLGSQKIINLATPTLTGDAATKGYVDSAIAVPAAAKFIIQTVDASVPNAQVLGSLTTGLLKNTTTTGILSIGVPGTDYYSLNNPTRIIDDSINFFIGRLAGNLSLSGTQNSGLGIASLTGLTTGSFNTAGGYQSSTGAITASRNSSFGYFSLLANLDSNDNCALGYQALSANGGIPGFNGHNNVAVGSSAGSLRSQYNNCVFLGMQADASVNNLTNAISIGYQASVSASNTMVLGGSGANQLSVGIGITPNAQFQLPTIHANRKIVLYETANNDHQVIGFGTAANTLAFQTDSDTLGVYSWKAAVSSSSSVELMNLTSLGGLAIGASTLTNRKVVLFGTTISPHQFLGFGANPNALRYQVDSTSSAHIFYAATSVSTSNELMRLTGTGFLGIGTTIPNAPLQFANTLVNRKIVLFEATSNDHQVHALGTNSGIFRFQVSATSDSYVWYAGTSSVASNELMRLTGGGFLGLGGITPNGQLQLPSNFSNRKIILYESVLNNDHQFFGLGINGLASNGALRYQIDNTLSANIWYAATSSTTSNELMRLTGIGRLGIGTTTPDQLLTVNSSTPSKITAGLWTGLSDARIKDIVGDYEHGLAEIIKIKTRKFKFNDRSGYPEHEKAKINIGIIAQEIEDIFPECIVEKIQKGDIPDMRMYDGTALTYALINAVKELNNEITMLKQQINN